MKKLCLISVLFFAINLYSQENRKFKHETMVYLGAFSTVNSGFGSLNAKQCAINFSYFWLPIQKLALGVNFAYRFPQIQDYTVREYFFDNKFKDFEINKEKKMLILAPEIKFFYTFDDGGEFYSGLSFGYGWHNGFQTDKKVSHFMWNVSVVGFNFRLGKRQNIILGGEIGIGFKGILSIHGGYRF